MSRDADDFYSLIFLEKMLFTKSPWETPYRIRHDLFSRWHLAGINHIATTFLVRSAEVRRDDPEGYSFIVADPSILVSVLEGYGAAKPRLLAIDWETLVPAEGDWWTREDQPSWRGNGARTFVIRHRGRGRRLWI